MQEDENKEVESSNSIDYGLSSHKCALALAYAKRGESDDKSKYSRTPEAWKQR